MLEWPLVGREAELRRLAAAAQDASRAGVSIVGEAGIGKTRLAYELLRLLAERGRVAAWIAASASARSIPYGALTQVLAIPSRSADQPGMHASLLDDLRHRRTDAGPIVLAVDDAHFLDDHSAAFVHLAIVQGAATVVLTARSGESVPPVLTQLWKDGLVERIEMRPLGEGDTRRLAKAALGGGVDSLTLSDLWRRSAGNALYLRELILGGIEAGTIVREDDTWRSTGPPIPSARLSELVRGRLGRLDHAQRAAIETLAVAGRLDLGLLETIASDGVVEQLEERRLLAVEQGGNRAFARLAHPVYAEVVTAEMPRSRVRRVMRGLADTLESRGARRRDDLLVLALWRLDGGGTTDADLLLEAAGEALASFDAGLAERLARAALGGGGAVRARLLLGRALTAQQRVDEADEVLAAAALEAMTDDEIAQVALARADLLYFRGGRMADATNVLLNAIEVVIDPDWVDELEALLVLFRAGAGQLHPVVEAGRRMSGRPTARPRAVVHTLVYSTIANIMLGRFAEAEAQIEIGLKLAPEVRSELPLGGAMLEINRVMAHAYAGDLERALGWGAQGVRSALDAGAADVVAMWSMNLAECQLLAGRPADALDSMLDSLAIVREADPFAVRGIDASLASICATWLGRWNLAGALRQEVTDHGLAIDVRSRIWFDRATVWGLASGRDSRTAARHAIDGAERAVADTHLVWGAWQLHDAVRLGHTEPAAGRLDLLAAQIEGTMVPTMALHGVALHERDGGKLERAARAFEQMGATLFAAEAAVHAHRSYLQRGRQRLARIAGARASLLAARCPGVRTPALVDVGPVPLTPRELDVARLAASGIPSRELADRLDISVRTVDNHLGAIYGKLGVRGRAELASVIGGVGERPPPA
jgi:DNA-binding CsgD family transcriptional regulator/tetratricopeptide (TPR) repeat protein